MSHPYKKKEILLFLESQPSWKLGFVIDYVFREDVRKVVHNWVRDVGVKSLSFE